MLYADELKEGLMKEAKRLDKVLSKYKVNNGIVTSKNFNVNGEKLYLIGDQLKRVGLGYTSAKTTILEQAKDIVDQIEAYVAKNGVSKEDHVVDANVETVPVTPNTYQEPTGDTIEGAEVHKKEVSPNTYQEPTGETIEGSEVPKKEVSPSEFQNVGEEMPDYESMTVAQLKETCKEFGVAVPKNATKAKLVGLLTK